MTEVPPIEAWSAAPLAGHVVLVIGGAQGIGRASRKRCWARAAAC